MRIRMKTLAAGPEVILHPNKEYTVADVVGAPLIEGGYAVRLDVPKAQPAEVEIPPTEPMGKPRRVRRGH